jgi:aspartate racemase
MAEHYCLGVVGGMGPRVSAEFLKTIYDAGAWAVEQDAPRVIVYSDPTVPDRTELLLRGEEEPLARRLGDAIERLLAAGATEVVIACVTIHRVLHRLPGHLRAPVVSLIDRALAEVAASGERHLLLCTTGTRRLRLFEDHPAWAGLRERIVLPSDDDQAAIHQLIYRVKNRQDDDLLESVQRLLAKYGVGSFVAGCTEFHLAAARLAASAAGPSFVDPLTLVARDVAAGRSASGAGSPVGA